MKPVSFTTLWIYTTPKPQKRAEAATGVCITGHSIAFYYITSLLSEKHIECHACENLFNYPAILHLFKCSNRHLKLLPAQKSRKYTTPKLRSSSSDVCKCFSTLWIYTTPKHFILQRVNELCFSTLWIYTTPKHNAVSCIMQQVLLPYEFTLLQNLKRGLKLLPVYVSQDIQLHFIISLPFCQKNILSAMLVKICSTTLRFCTSSNAQIGI